MSSFWQQMPSTLFFRYLQQILLRKAVITLQEFFTVRVIGDDGLQFPAVFGTVYMMEYSAQNV